MLILIDSSINSLLNSIKFLDKKELIKRIREIKYQHKENEVLCDELGIALQSIILINDETLLDYKSFIDEMLNNKNGDYYVR